MLNNAVAVIDSGIDQRNKRLMKHVITGINIEYSAEKKSILVNEKCNDENGHGTNCIDTILQICPQLMFYPIKIINAKGMSSSELLNHALEICLELPVDVISISLAVIKKECENMEEMQSICNRLSKQKKIIVASDNNNRYNAIPASLKGVIGVKTKEEFQKGEIEVQPNDSVQVIIDERPIFVEGIDHRFNFFKGNSEASAVIAGVIEKMLIESNLSKDEILDKLKESYMKYYSNANLRNICIGKRDDEESMVKVIQKVIYQISDHNVSAEDLKRYPLISDITGLSFFNFFEFIKSINQAFDIHIQDYHTLKIDDVCRLEYLLEYIRRKSHEKYKQSDKCFEA